MTLAWVRARLKRMNSDKRFIKRLTRDDFADALRKGLGRALLHVLHYGLDDVADLVLEACLHCQIYDVECETSRGAWLFQMFRDSPRYSEFRDAIQGHLTGDGEVSAADAWELCALLKEMAANGDAGARQTLGEVAREQARLPQNDDPAGVEDWVDLEGREGLLEVARIYGRRTRLNPQDCVPANILYMGDSEHEIKAVLFQAAQTDPDIKAYWDYLEDRGAFDDPPRSGLPARLAALADTVAEALADPAAQQRQREKVRKKYSVESILQDARNRVGEIPSQYDQFGRYATADELKEIYAHLVNETDAAVQLRLLWVFRRAPLPELNEMFFRWADGMDAELRSAAIATLAQTADERVHELARAKVRAGQLVGPDCGALGLFLNNYATEDARLITQALSSLDTNVNDVHRLASDLADLAEEVRDVALADALKWGYENTPCINCRSRIVKQLSVVGRLDAERLFECGYDADEEIRAFAKSLPITGFEPTEHRGLGRLRDWQN